MKDPRNMMRRAIACLIAALCIVGCLHPFAMTAYAKGNTTIVKGDTYEFAKDAHYEFSSSRTSGSSSFGTFSISGGLKSIGNKNGVLAYSVDSESIDFYYSYSLFQLDVAETVWHLIDDKTKKVDTISLDKNILSGAIIVRSSKNGVDWIEEAAMTNVFSVDTNLRDTFYTTKRIQLENGCYYQVIVAYELQIKTGEKKIGPVTTDVTEEKKIAEVYEFYAISSETASNTASAAATPRKELGQKINTGKDNGYSGSEAIDKDDPHYGWNLGTFVMNGYTRETSYDGVPVFLKNVGDKVTLWFTLAQDIDKLNGNSALTIAEDTNGYDQYFEVGQTNFKRGTLIIRYTDHEGNVHEPVIYTDFLAANATTGADTRVQLFEEGDYEVSLDYEIKESALPLSKYTDYKIFFRFSIRNGNCMVFPFDMATGAELSNQAITPNGFRLDMARSRYLTIDVIHTVLTMGADGQLAGDVRFDRPAKDNDAYIDEGIYTFTVKNLYTGETMAKTIYVGTNKYLLALSKNSLTLEALNEKLSQDATVGDDGTVVDYVPPAEPTAAPNQELPETPVPEGLEAQPIIDADTPVNDGSSESPAVEVPGPEAAEAPQSGSLALLVAVVLAAVVGAAFVAASIMKRAKQKKEGVGI